MNLRCDMKLECDSQCYTLSIVDGRASLQFKYNDYEVINMDELNSMLENAELPNNDMVSELLLYQMKDIYDSIFNENFANGNIYYKVKKVVDDSIMEKISADFLEKSKQREYTNGIARLLKKLEVDFNITNQHDQKLIANKLSNQYNKHNGNIFDIRACYTNGDDTPDDLFSYIKKYQRESGVYEQLLYNDVTKSHILIGFGYPDYLR